MSAMLDRAWSNGDGARLRHGYECNILGPNVTYCFGVRRTQEGHCLWTMPLRTQKNFQQEDCEPQRVHFARKGVGRKCEIGLLRHVSDATETCLTTPSSSLLSGVTFGLLR